MESDYSAYFGTIARLGRSVAVTDGAGRPLSAEDAVAWVQRTAQGAHDGGRKVMFIGNGGSAGISSHSAIDYSKNGNIRSTAFNDGAALTCLGNDLGYENVFAKQVDLFAQPGDLLVAISSSGNSPNIRNAVTVARGRGCAVVTFSGFKDGNPLRAMGDVNFYVASMEYGFVELVHQSIIHAILDLHLGWRSGGGEA